MTTPTASAAPQFQVRSRHSALRAVLIAVLCSALAGTFIAEVWNTPGASQQVSGRA